MTISLWVYPAPATRSFNWWSMGFEDITIIFTWSDGSTAVFLPIDRSGRLALGETEMIGAIWFHYTPNQAATWTAQFTFLEKPFGDPPDDDVFYEAAVSPIVTFECAPLFLSLIPQQFR